MPECGCITAISIPGKLDGDTNSDGEYVSAVTGYHQMTGFENVEYDEIKNNNKNRWHLQNYWEQKPESPLGIREAIATEDFFEISTNNSDFVVEFGNYSPDTNDLSNSNEYSIDLGVSIPKTPYISAGTDISVRSGDSGAIPTEEPYERVEWELVPDNNVSYESQDDSGGVKFDVNINNAEENSVSPWCGTQQEYAQYGAGGSISFYMTPVCSLVPTVDIV